MMIRFRTHPKRIRLANAHANFYESETARTRILGYGGAIEVLEPLALRQSVADFAQQICNRYVLEQP